MKKRTGVGGWIDLAARPREEFAGLRRTQLAWFHMGELNTFSWAPGTEARVLGD